MPFRKILSAFLAAVAITAPVTCLAQDPFAVPGTEPTEPVKASLVAEQDAIVPGKTFTVALRLEHAEHWHTYWRNSGDLGQPTKFIWKLPEGFTAADAVWPIPKMNRTDDGLQHLFEGTLYILTDITPPAALKEGDKVNLEASVTWLQCEESGQCQPRKNIPVTLSLPVGAKAEKNAESAAFDEVRKVQPVPVPAWKVSVESKGDAWVVRAEPGAGASSDPGTIYFFDAAAAISDDKQKWTKDGAAQVLEVAKRKADSPVKPWGYLQAAKSWVEGGKVSLLPVGAVPAPQSSVPPPNGVEPTGPVSPPAPQQTTGAANEDDLIKTIRGWGVRPLGEEKAEERLTWPLALVFAFIGGIILNLMPCVFPVLGIKILGFVRQSGEDTAAVKKHGLVYAAGVIVSLLALAGVLLAIRTGSEKFGWGFQLQSPVFLTFLILLLFALSLNLAGLFEIGTSLTSVGAELQNESGYKGSFFSGLLTVILATPCTGPFMGPALGFALSEQTPRWLVIAIFAALAIGLALPYVVLSWFPALIKKLPRPGAWMETFKKTMAFPMFATCAWLISVFTASTGTSGLLRLLFALVAFAMALWLYGKFGTPVAKPKSKVRGLTVAAICLIGGFWLAWSGAHKKGASSNLEEGELAMTAQSIIERREKGLTTVVDFWAVWCAQCETNKKLAFSDEEFQKALKENHAVLMIADSSNENPLSDKFLAAYGQGGIPFAIVIPPKGPVIQLPTVMGSAKPLLKGLEEAKKQAAGK